MISAIITPSYTKDGQIHHIHLTDDKTNTKLATLFSENIEILEMNVIQSFILMYKLGYLTQEQFDSLATSVGEALPK